MLYDPKWGQKTKAKPFSLASLTAWLETQNPEKTYCYERGGECLLHSYFVAMGFKNVLLGGTYLEHGDNKRVTLSRAFEEISVCHPRTFGGALERARKWPER